MYGFVYLFYLCEQALMIIEVRIVVISGRGVYTEKIQQGNFWDAGSNIYFNLDDGSQVYIHIKIYLAAHLKQCTLCTLYLLSLKSKVEGKKPYKFFERTLAVSIQI